MRFCGHLKNGAQLLLSDDEIINNAVEQEKSGIKPHYAFYDWKNKKAVTPAGWLVWSLFDGGCGVVYRREDGKMIICTGVQSDFFFFFYNIGRQFRPFCLGCLGSFGRFDSVRSLSQQRNAYGYILACFSRLARLVAKFFLNF